MNALVLPEYFVVKSLQMHKDRKQGFCLIQEDYYFLFMNQYWWYFHLLIFFGISFEYFERHSLTLVFQCAKI